ncbi:MAG TPA: hypothetical protein VFH61_08825, partial [Thermoleophilia bacterium]|nr:hypothetical protein [Thermoleophilia bacterium]
GEALAMALHDIGLASKAERVEALAAELDRERAAREQAEATAARRLDELAHAQQAANAAARQCDVERARRERAERERSTLEAVVASMRADPLRARAERAERERDEARDLYTETEKKHCAALTKLDAAEADLAALRDAYKRLIHAAGRVVQEARHHELPNGVRFKLRDLETASGPDATRAALRGEDDTK